MTVRKRGEGEEAKEGEEEGQAEGEAEGAKETETEREMEEKEEEEQEEEASNHTLPIAHPWRSILVIVVIISVKY